MPVQTDRARPEILLYADERGNVMGGDTPHPQPLRGLRLRSRVRDPLRHKEGGGAREVVLRAVLWIAVWLAGEDFVERSVSLVTRPRVGIRYKKDGLLVVIPLYRNRHFKNLLPKLRQTVTI